MSKMTLEEAIDNLDTTQKSPLGKKIHGYLNQVTLAKAEIDALGSELLILQQTCIQTRTDLRLALFTLRELISEVDYWDHEEYSAVVKQLEKSYESS